MNSSTGSTRDRLINAAMELFHQKGYGATGIAEILKKAEVNSGSLYYFFPKKEDLLVAVLERYRELLIPIVMQPVFDRTNDPIDRVFGVLEEYRKALEMTECTYGCPIGNLALEVVDELPKARALIAENFENWRLVIRRCLEEAGSRLPADVDRDKLATLVLTVMEGGVMQSRTRRNLAPYMASVAMLREFFDRMLVREATL